MAGLFTEAHKSPEQALSDGSNSLALERLPSLLTDLTAPDRTVRAPDARRDVLPGPPSAAPARPTPRTHKSP
ncbi:hypothetical protein [Streptomyces pinistramenti]|uniref:hypothetical protein n=1 Tax=Streptomyces pinistramenti TaxID=2884812 RepID=UPI001D07C081|nr:hypothetical protein [Streptomyces pinistramenti]MCB5906239.1 hypothetical protein [Streptomyces pinistramenti]